MKAFVTGAAGLPGSSLIRTLHWEGYEVRECMNGCDLLFHTDTQLESITGLLEEAEARGLRKVIYIGSAAVLGKKPSGAPADEFTPLRPMAGSDAFIQAKLQTEREIAAFRIRSSLPITTLWPTWMMGPQDAGYAQGGSVILDFLRGRPPVPIDGGVSIVDSRDVAQAAIEAVHRGVDGERYIVGGSYYGVDEILSLLAKLTGVALTRSAGAMAFVRTVHHNQRVTSRRAMSELGVTFRPLYETLRDTIDWFHSHSGAAQGVVA